MTATIVLCGLYAQKLTSTCTVKSYTDWNFRLKSSVMHRTYNRLVEFSWKMSFLITMYYNVVIILNSHKIPIMATLSATVIEATNVDDFKKRIFTCL